MSGTVSPISEAKKSMTARSEHILAAAEACFVRNGFHRTTMQDIAREAAMSPGNIYRYFESKEAVVLGLAAREGERGAALVERLQRDGDKRAGLLGIIEQFFVATSREAAVLRLELWSESTRNPVIAAMLREHEEALRSWFTETLAELRSSPDCDVENLYEILNGQMRSILVSRAVLDDFDAGPAAARLHAILDGGLAGRLAFLGPAAEG